MVETHKKLIPKLRFSCFKNDWNFEKLGNIGEFKNGFNADKSSFGTGVPFINLMDIFGENQIKKKTLGLVEVNTSLLSQYSVRYGDVLFVRSSVKREGVAQSCLVNDEFENTVYSGFIIRFRQFNNKLDHHFQKYCFASPLFRKKALAKSTSSANTNINQESLSALILGYPSSEEQQKIATFLSAVDDKLTNLRRKRELLGNYKRGLMQQLFSQQIRFKQDDGSVFPEWEDKQLGDLGSFRGGGTPSTNIEKYWQGEVPWLSSSDLLEGSLKTGKITRFITKEAIKNSATKVVPARSLLIVSRVGVGKIAVSLNDICTSQDFSNFTPYKDDIFFLGYLLLFQKNILLSIGQGTSIKGFTNSDLAALKVKLPEINEQEKIANFLQSVDNKIDAVAKQIIQLDTFKKGLLQKLFV